MTTEKKELKIVVEIVHLEICQDCGGKFEVKRECPTGYVCDECLEMASIDYDAYEDKE